MAVKPIIFNTEMVRSILNGRKEATRRVIKPQPIYNEHDGFEWRDSAYGLSLPPTLKGAVYNFRCACPYQPGDILYARETWNTNPLHEYGNEPNKYVYKADYDGHAGDFGWKPSIHMPKEAGRIWLKVTDVRAERLQDITVEQAMLEGVSDDMAYSANDWKPTFYDPDSGGKPEYIKAFSYLWDSTIKKKDLPLYGWDANPYVWVIEFERIEKPKGEQR